MFESGIFWLRVATGLYGVGLLHSFLTLFRRKTGLFPAALGAFCAAVVLHVVSEVEVTRALGRFPVDNFYESSALCALLLALAFLFTYALYRFATLSVFVFPLVFVMAQVGSMEIPVASWPSSGLRDAWLLIHVVMVLLGYACLMLTALASLFYLLQERHLKNKQAGGFFERLPPLAVLDTLITHSMSFGFVFITIGVIAGSAWAFIESGTAWIADPKIGLSLLTWGFYLLMVFLRASAGWRGRRAAVLSVVVLGCSALTWAAHIGLRTLLVR